MKVRDDTGNGWVTATDNHGHSATYYHNGVELVALWQPTWAELLVKLTKYNADGTRRRDGRV